MPTFFDITLPFNGNIGFNPSVGSKLNDLIPLTTNRWVSAIVQISQTIVYLNIIDFTDFENSNTFTNTKTLLIKFLKDVQSPGVYLIKITDQRVALFIERDVYIVDIVGSDITVVHHETNFFARGAKNRALLNYDGQQGDTGKGYGESFYAKSFKDNEFFVMDQEDDATAIAKPSQTGNSSTYAYRFMHIVYDPILKTLTKNSRRLFVAGDSDTPTTAGYMFKLHINPIPNSSNFYMSFNISRSILPQTVNSSQLYPVYFYSAIINDSGVLQTLKTYPNRILNFDSWDGGIISQQNTNPTASVALSENLFIWHPQNAVNLVMEYNGDFTNIVDPGGLNANYSRCTDIIPLDSGHYMMRWVDGRFTYPISSERIYVYRVINNLIIELGNVIAPNTFSSSYGYNPRKYQMYKLTNNLFAIVYGNYTSTTNALQIGRIKI